MSVALNSTYYENGEAHERNQFGLWLASTAAIFIISLCGIFGVLVIPIMQKVFYRHLIQFLVALAIGTLSGDALLHLYPHALLANFDSHQEEFHRKSVWKGFAALLALLMFFLFERLICLIGEWQTSKCQNLVELPHSSIDGLHGQGVLHNLSRHSASRHSANSIQSKMALNGHQVSENSLGQERLFKHKYISVDDILSQDKKSPSGDENEVTTLMVGTYTTDSLVQNSNNEGSHDILNKTEADKIANQANGTILDPNGPIDTSNHDKFAYVHEHKGHSPSHIHSAPNSISSVAWMVIFGDGIHNFVDGLAIGAAFNESYTSGLSTSIAILCHELPHEVGDFAMLLKAGMSVKKAVFYNMLSSVISFVGMILGHYLGDFDDFTPWIFTGTAGIFLYVALVDMIPELNSGHSHSYNSKEQNHSKITELCIQVLGMMLGGSIMLLIMLYELDMKTIFQDSHSH